MLKRNLMLLCLAMLIGGGAAMKFALSRRAAKTRSMSFIEAAAGTQWIRNDAGHIRWYVPAWAVFWLLAFVAIGALVH